MSFNVSAAAPSSAKLECCALTSSVFQLFTFATRVKWSRKLVHDVLPLYGRTVCCVVTTTIGTDDWGDGYCIVAGATVGVAVIEEVGCSDEVGSAIGLTGELGISLEISVTAGIEVVAV